MKDSFVEDERNQLMVTDQPVTGAELPGSNEGDELFPPFEVTNETMLELQGVYEWAVCESRRVDTSDFVIGTDGKIWKELAGAKVNSAVLRLFIFHCSRHSIAFNLKRFPSFSRIYAAAARLLAERCESEANDIYYWADEADDLDRSTEDYLLASELDEKALKLRYGAWMLDYVTSAWPKKSEQES